MVRVAPVKAIKFTKLPLPMQQVLLYNGAVPVNDIFLPLWNDKSKIWLLYGGYGSGKSVFIVDYLIDRCLNTDYFKCIYGRKILDTVRESVFATLTDRIEERGLQHKFTYNTGPKSSMRITCVDNGNVFIPFGADKVSKLKSLKDPTHIFAEEMDQFDETDFQVLYARLRKKGVELKFIGAFNTATVTPQHWIKTFFFNPDKPFEGSLTKMFCNYTDNFFIDQKDYEEVLWIAAGFNETKFRQHSAGEWGSADTDNLWAYAFNRTKHVIDVTRPEGAAFMELDKRLPVYLVFDFNVDPMTCLVCQKNGMMWAKIIGEYRLRNSDIFELCERIKIDLDEYFLVVTGDASGRNRNAGTKGKASFVDTIKSELRLSSKQIQFPVSNPSIFNTRMVVNAVFHKHTQIFVSSSCLYTIDDLETIKTDGKGGIQDQKKLELDQKGHLFANVRYFFWNYFRTFVNFKFKT